MISLVRFHFLRPGTMRLWQDEVQPVPGNRFRGLACTVDESLPGEPQGELQWAMGPVGAGVVYAARHDVFFATGAVGVYVPLDRLRRYLTEISMWTMYISGFWRKCQASIFIFVASTGLPEPFRNPVTPSLTALNGRLFVEFRLK